MLSGLVSSGMTGPTRSPARRRTLTLTGSIGTALDLSKNLSDIVLNNQSNTTYNRPQLRIDGYESGISIWSNTNVGIVSSGIGIALFKNDVTLGLMLKSTMPFSWGSADINGAADTFLYRDAANTIGQRDGVNAQTFRLYNTFASPSSYETLNLKGKTAANFEIGPESGSAGGTLRGLTIGGYAAGTATIASWLSFTSAGVATFAGQVIESPPASVTLATNGQLSIEMTSNTAGNLVYRGSDGTTRRSALVFA